MTPVLILNRWIFRAINLGLVPTFELEATPETERQVEPVPRMEIEFESALA